MRGDELLDKMELADPQYVEEADDPPKARRPHWKRWTAMAASFVLIAAAAVFARGMFRCGSAAPESPGEGTACEEESAAEDTEIKGEAPATSDTYETLDQLLEDLSKNDHHSDDKTEGAENGISGTKLSGSRSVTVEKVTYQLTKEGIIGIYKENRLISTLNTEADSLFLIEGQLVTVGEYQSGGNEIHSESSVRVQVYSLEKPEEPRLLHSFTQLGSLTAAFLRDDVLMLMTSDGVCACGWSRLEDTEDYKPKLSCGQQEISWEDSEISILGEPSSVRYAAVTAIEPASGKVLGKHAYYGDILEIFYDEESFSILTQTMTETEFSRQELYTFEQSYVGKLSMADLMGLPLRQALTKNGMMPPGIYPSVLSVSKQGAVLRAAGVLYTVSSEEVPPSVDLMVLAWNQQTGEREWKTLDLPEEYISLDDVVWERDRAILSVGVPLEDRTRLVLADFSGTSIEVRDSGLICDRVTGIDRVYGYGNPLGKIRPFIPLGNGLYLRYNGVPDGLDLYDLRDSNEPVQLYRSAGNIPEGCRLDFEPVVLDERTVAVKMLTPENGDYRHLRESWLLFEIDESAHPPVKVTEEYPALPEKP